MSRIKTFINKKNSTDKKEQVVESLSLPKDIMLGASIITSVGNREALVENYKGIIEYSTECIMIQGKTCQICFQGKRLSIDYYTNEDMKITGYIQSISYL